MAFFCFFLLKGWDVTPCCSQFVLTVLEQTGQLLLSGPIYCSDVYVTVPSHYNMKTLLQSCNVLCAYQTVKGKGKGHPRTGHEIPDGEKMYRFTLYLTSALDAGGWSTPRPGRFIPGKDPVPIVQEAGWAPGPVWTGAENVAPTGIRSPDGPARSESLYRLDYRSQQNKLYFVSSKLSCFWCSLTLFHIFTIVIS